MPSGARRLLLAGGSLPVLLGLGACTDGVAMAPSPVEIGATSAPADADVAVVMVASTDVATTVESTDPTPATSVDPAGTTRDVAVTTVATTTAPSTVVSTSVAGETTECTPVVALADAVALAEGIDFSLPWAQLQTTIAESSEAAAVSYLAVVDVAPADVDGSLRVLAAYNRALGASATAAASVTAFQAAVAPPDAALLAATTDVDRYMRATCSIGLSAD